jgi:hypothetical protein
MLTRFSGSSSAIKTATERTIDYFPASKPFGEKDFMKKAILFLSFFACLFVFSANVRAQKTVEPQVQRDPIMEADHLHNLDVAWQAFKLKKAYRAVLLRTEVIIAAYPDFSRFDEVLYL